MASKTDFTAQEWEQIITAPQMAALYVALASPSNPVGLVQEMFASSMSLMEAMKAGSSNTLIAAVAADFKEKVEKREKQKPPEMSKDPNEVKAQCLQALRDLASLLSQKAPAEAEGYEKWVLESAQRTAQAAKEGGFLGIGGQAVNDAEVAALKEIAGALGVSASS
jgi:hypothetical protein